MSNDERLDAYRQKYFLVGESLSAKKGTWAMGRDLSDTFQKALSIVRGLPQDMDPRTKIEHVRWAIISDLTGPEDRQAFGGLVFGRMKSWDVSDGFHHLAELLIVVLSVNSDSQDEASNFSLRCIQSAVSDVNDTDVVRELAAIVESVLHYFNNTLHSVNLYHLNEVFTQSRVLPFFTLCRMGIALLGGRRIGFRVLSLREVVEKIFADQATGHLPPETVREGVKEIVKGVPTSKLAHALPGLEFDVYQEGDYPAACTTFLKACFSPEKPLLLLLISPNDLSGREVCRLIKTEDIEGPASPENVKAKIIEHGVPLTEPSSINSYLAEDFLERDVEARAVSKRWLDRRLKHTPEGPPPSSNLSGKVIPFTTRGRT